MGDEDVAVTIAVAAREAEAGHCAADWLIWLASARRFWCSLVSGGSTIVQVTVVDR